MRINVYVRTVKHYMQEQLELISCAIESCRDDNISLKDIHTALEPAAKKYSIALIKVKVCTENPIIKKLYENPDIIPDENPFCYENKIDNINSEIYFVLLLIPSYPLWCL